MELQLVNERRRGPYAAKRLSEFAERCRKGGLAVTPQRLAIIKALLDSGDHPRAASAYLARDRASHAGNAVRHRRGAQGHDAARQRALRREHHTASSCGM